jgi:hypothetical protein
MAIMSWYWYVLILTALVTPIVYRMASFWKRKMKTPTQIIGQLEQLPFQYPVEESEMFGPERDRALWAQIGGVKGLATLRNKAVLLKDFVASLDLADSDGDEMIFIAHRCYWIIALVALQFVLLPLRTPHFLARWAVGLYSEMSTRSLTLCRHYAPELYPTLKAIT